MVLVVVISDIQRCVIVVDSSLCQLFGSCSDLELTSALGDLITSGELHVQV